MYLKVLYLKVGPPTVAQAQEARIQQLEAQSRAEAVAREGERQQLIADFRTEIAGLRSQMAADGAAIAGSRLPASDHGIV